MMMTGGVLAAVVAELEKDIADSEISVPDETSSICHFTTTNRNNDLQGDSHPDKSGVEKPEAKENIIQTFETKTDTNTFVNGNEINDRDTFGSIHSRNSETAGEQGYENIKHKTVEFDMPSDKGVTEQITDPDTFGSIHSRNSETAGEQGYENIKHKTVEFDMPSDKGVTEQITDPDTFGSFHSRNSETAGEQGYENIKHKTVEFDMPSDKGVTEQITDPDTFGSFHSRKSETAGEQSNENIKHKTVVEFDIPSDNGVTEQLADIELSNSAHLEGRADEGINDDKRQENIDNQEFLKNELSAPEEVNGEEYEQRSTASNSSTNRKVKATAEPQMCHVTPNPAGPLNIQEYVHGAERVEYSTYSNESKHIDIGSLENTNDLLSTKDEIENGLVKDEIIQTEICEFAKLTKENLEQHTKILHEAVSKNKTIQQETKNADKGNDDISFQRKDNYLSKSDKGVSTEDEVSVEVNDERRPEGESKTPSAVHIENDTRRDSKLSNVTRSISKMPLQENMDTVNREVEKHVIYASSPIPYKSQSKISDKKLQNSKIKRKVKKTPQINVGDVETLVSKHKWTYSENRKRCKNKTKLTESTKDRSTQSKDRMHEDSGIEKYIDEHNDTTDDLADRSCSEKENLIDEVRASEKRRLLKRVIPRRYTKRPMYDAMNTSTQMILLNNKYGKNSRLWKTRVNQPNRGSLIDPNRHLKEPAFYLSGDFHIRCATEEKPVRHKFPQSHIKFDFSDRPETGKIGERLYEARLSVNPNRHRTCNSTPETKSKPLDFSPPDMKGSLPIYVFEWERLYADLSPRHSRTASMVRPPSTLSGKKSGKVTVKIPELTHEAVTIETDSKVNS